MIPPFNKEGQVFYEEKVHKIMTKKRKNGELSGEKKSDKKLNNDNDVIIQTTRKVKRSGLGLNIRVLITQY